MEGEAMDTNLVLIVGTNPLPNYVVGSFFKEAKPYENLILVYSEETDFQEGTSEYAEIIKKMLNMEYEHVKFIPIRDVGNPPEILEQIKKGFENISGKIHLNYTGGTKTLVVNCYKFLSEKYKKDFSSSYLDARRFKIVYEDGKEEPNEGDLRDVFKKIGFTISDLLCLHLYELKKEVIKRENCPFESVLNAMKRNIDKLNEYIEWMEKIRVIYKNKYIKSSSNILERTSTFLKNINILRHLNLGYEEGNTDYIEEIEANTPEFIWDILNSFPEDKRLNDGKKLWIPDKEISNNNLKKHLKDTFSFLDGKWLEWFVYDQLYEDLKKEGFNEGEHFGMALNPIRNSNRFDLDIFILNGYELIGISITTSNKKREAKLKGFEVFHRVKQIGGDESRAFLVTCLDKDKAFDLEKDLVVSTGTTAKQILVFSIDDIPQIGNRIIKEVLNG